MKYWVYKDSRILGPLDKDGVAGLPGLDADTLVCAGESSATGEGDWRPAGDVADLAALPLNRGTEWLVDDQSVAFSLLDALQIDSAGSVGDDEFSGTAEPLFQDARLGRAFADRPPPLKVDDAELRRANDRAAELLAQLETLRKRVAELEAGQAPSLAPPEAPDVPAPAEMPVSAPSLRTAFRRKAFKIVPTAKAFRIAAAEGPPAAGASPTPEAEAAPLAPAELETASAPAPDAVAFEAAPTPEPASAPSIFEAIAQETAPPPAAAPPTVFSFGNAAQSKPEEPLPPPAAVFSAVDDMVGEPPAQEALARFAKPAPAPAAEAPRASRSSKPFLVVTAALVIVMAAVGALFLRHPKDLKQMADLDDGRARVGAEQAEDAPRPAAVKPEKIAPPAGVAAPAAPQASSAGGASAGEASQAASSAALDAAVSAVKNFPLDGERGTVAQWLQFSYSASPDAGKESWNASETADKTYLVEYRFTPSARGDEVHYLFEVDMGRGFVIGKNLDAKSVLAGGPRAAAKQAKPQAKRRNQVARPKKTVKRAIADRPPKDVPLLPLPKAGELRPPAEDDGTFDAETDNSGL